jgi:uroporphyrinogen-III synthase
VRSEYWTESVHRITCEMNLLGVRVLVTRPAGQAAGMARLIEQQGGIALVAPMIRIVPPADWYDCDGQLDRLSSFHGVVFTSANGAEMFLRRMAERGQQVSSLSCVATYAIGKKTADVLETAGVPPVYVPETFSGAELGAFFRGQNPGGSQFLLPRGDRAREEVADGLRQAGARVVPIVVYRTVGPDASAVALVHSVLGERGIDVVTFASPSAVEHFVEILNPDLRSIVHSSVVIGAIGGTTALAIRRLGLPVHVTAETATAEGLIDALVSWTPVVE